VRRSYHDLILEEKLSDAVPLEESAKILAKKIFDKTLILKNWDDTIEQWIARTHWIASRHPELEIQLIDSERRLQILEMICHGATSYKQIKNIKILPTLKSWLSNEQLAAVEIMAPTHIYLPCGKKTKVHYSPSSSPRISAKIQDLYDVENSITIDNEAAIIEILAPNFRPIQITTDLKQFWQDQYPQIKQQLQRKYPKHTWR
jgi:ATP-dependent helicase HrpB